MKAPTIMAHDGETALELLHAGAFELVLLDENLPGINGSAVALSLLDRPDFPRPFVASMTGDSDSNEELARLFDVSLQKPFSLETGHRRRAEQQQCELSSGSLAARHIRSPPTV
jgi:CheY-like chemotaxis protein